jgi:hypothetical protein
MVGMVDPSSVFLNVSLLVRALSAVGFIFLLWLIFQIVSIIYNRKKQRLLEKLVDQLSYLERKLNRIEDKLENKGKRK